MYYFIVLEPEFQDEGAGRATLSLRFLGESFLESALLRLVAVDPWHFLVCGCIILFSASLVTYVSVSFFLL